MLDTLPEDGGRFELTEEDANAWVARSTTSGWRWESCSTSARTARIACPTTIRWPCIFDVYQWLTVLQEYLVLVLMGPR